MSSSSGLPKLLLIMGALTGVVAMLIAAFVETATWGTMALALIAVIAGTVVVLIAIGRALSEDE